MHDNIRCEFCKSESFSFYIKNDLVSYSKCKDCGLIFQHPVLTQTAINEIYDGNYFEYEVSNQESFFELMLLGLKDIDFENAIENKLPNKRFLDIGCATGMLLNNFKSRGFEVEGVEICKASVEYARKTYDLNIHNKPLLDVGFPDNHFSLIHFSHLIEHVPNPADFLKEIYRILMPKGYAIITTPNEEGIFSRHYKENWRAVMPQHLWLFSKTTLSKYIESLGFKIVDNYSWGSIPAEKKHNKTVKAMADKFVKVFNKGDVMLFLCYKD